MQEQAAASPDTAAVPAAGGSAEEPVHTQPSPADDAPVPAAAEDVQGPQVSGGAPAGDTASGKDEGEAAGAADKTSDDAG